MIEHRNVAIRRLNGSVAFCASESSCQHQHASCTVVKIESAAQVIFCDRSC